MKTPVDSTFESVFAKIFNKPGLKVFREMTPADIPGWSSLLHIKLLVALEKQYKVELAPEDVVALKNVGELFDLINKNLKS